MNIFKKLCFKLSSRHVERLISRRFSNNPSLIAERLNERSLIRVQGQEVVPFLQGLITNDMTHLQRGSRSIYTMFLNNAGRVLYDSIIYRTTDETVFLIECDKSVCNELRRHLRLFRVRRKIEIDSIGSDYIPWVVFRQQSMQPASNLENVALKEGATNEQQLEEISMLRNGHDFDGEKIVGYQDPRIKALGVRVIMPAALSFSELGQHFDQHSIIEATPQEDYKYLRYSLGVGEGVLDHPITKCFPLEANCDFLHGVSFHKGCYIGQELTARVHHTGVIRKRLMPIKLTKKVDEGIVNVQSVGGTVVGTLRGVKNDVALALLRVEQVMKAPNLVIDGDPCVLIIPDWWPVELPNKYALKKEQAENA